MKLLINARNSASPELSYQFLIIEYAYGGQKFETITYIEKHDLIVVKDHLKESLKNLEEFMKSIEIKND